MNVFVYEGGSWCGNAVSLTAEDACVYGFYPASLPVTGEAVVPSCSNRTIPVKIVNPEYFGGENQADYMLYGGYGTGAWRQNPPLYFIRL